MTTTPAMPELPEPFALSVSVHEGDTPAKTYVECVLYQKHPNEKQRLYTADQMRAYALDALQSQPAAAGVSDAEINRILSTPIPGGSVASHWFLPHDTGKGLANVRDVVRAMLTSARAIIALRPQAVPMTDEPEWIVNDLGELGVRVGSRFFFLYKGGNIKYGVDGIGDSRDGVALHDDGTPMHYRIVGKREFGETCWPLQWVVRGHSESRYTEPLTFIPGLSWGTPEDGEWKPLPAHGITAQGAQGGEG